MLVYYRCAWEQQLIFVLVLWVDVVGGLLTYYTILTYIHDATSIDMIVSGVFCHDSGNTW